MSAPEECITRASEVMHGPLPPYPPDASPETGPEPANGAGFAPDTPEVMRDAVPIGVHHASLMHGATPENASPVHHPASDAVTLAFRLLDRARSPEVPQPSCVSCSSPVARAEHLLCDRCYQRRRPAGPGPILPNPERRARLEARLARTPCGTCGATTWYVTDGGATCGPCSQDRQGAA